MSQETAIEGQKLVIKRTFAAPVEKVYEAWTDPAKMARWFSPNTRWNMPKLDIDPVPGGNHNITMRHSDGDVFRNFGHYVEVVPNERLSFTWTWMDNPAGLEETLVTIEFRAVASGTELTLIHDRLTSSEAQQSTSQGWAGCLEMLASYLEGTPLLGGE